MSTMVRINGYHVIELILLSSLMERIVGSNRGIPYPHSFVLKKECGPNEWLSVLQIPFDATILLFRETDSIIYRGENYHMIHFVCSL